MNGKAQGVEHQRERIQKASLKKRTLMICPLDRTLFRECQGWTERAFLARKERNLFLGGARQKIRRGGCERSVKWVLHSRDMGQVWVYSKGFGEKKEVLKDTSHISRN